MIENISITHVHEFKTFQRDCADRKDAFASFNRAKNNHRYGITGHAGELVEMRIMRNGITIAFWQAPENLTPDTDFSPANGIECIYPEMNPAIVEQPEDLAPAEMFQPADNMPAIYPEQHSPTQAITGHAWVSAEPVAREYFFFSRDVSGFFKVANYHSDLYRLVSLLEFRLGNGYDLHDYNTRNHVSSFLAMRKEV